MNEVGLPDAFLPHADRSEILAEAGLTPQQIARDIVAQMRGAKLPAARQADADARIR